MTITEIARVKPGTVAPLSGSNAPEEIKDLAQRAEDLLGYSGMSNRVRGVSKAEAMTGALTDALKELEIQVLEVSSVLTYQMEELTRRTRIEIERDLSLWCTGWFSPASWGHTDLSSYSDPIPEFVINKAIQIKERLPEVKFYIQHLNDPDADPFLIAVLNKEVYYIEVWDEPRFERL